MISDINCIYVISWTSASSGCWDDFSCLHEPVIRRRKRPEFWTESFTWVMQRRKTKVTQRSDEGGSVLWPELVHIWWRWVASLSAMLGLHRTGKKPTETPFHFILGCKTKQIPESFPDIRYSSTKGWKTYPNFPKFPSGMPSNFQ